jgi:hypothetical protein
MVTAICRTVRVSAKGCTPMHPHLFFPVPSPVLFCFPGLFFPCYFSAEVPVPRGFLAAFAFFSPPFTGICSRVAKNGAANALCSPPPRAACLRAANTVYLPLKVGGRLAEASRVGVNSTFNSRSNKTPTRLSPLRASSRPPPFRGRYRARCSTVCGASRGFDARSSGMTHAARATYCLHA